MKWILLLLIATAGMASCKKSAKPDGSDDKKPGGPSNELILEKTVNILCNGDFSIPWQVANVGGYNYLPVRDGLPSNPTSLKNFDTNLGIQGYEVETDASGNVYTLGKYQRKTDFDPGPDSVLLEPMGFYLQNLMRQVIYYG